VFIYIAGSGRNSGIRQLIVNMIPLILITLLNYNAFAQDSIKRISPNINKQISSIIDIDFFTTFAGINVINGTTGNDCNNLYLYYNLTVSNKFKVGKFLMTNNYFTEFGFRKYSDSISTVSDDQYNFKNSFSYCFGNSGFAFNLSIISKSQYFNHYDYKSDSVGHLTKYLFTSYLSPGYTNFSGGIKYEFNDNCSVELGLVNGRSTKVKNQKLFESRGVDQLYGLETGTSKKTEYGLILVVSFPVQRIIKNVFIENYSQVNATNKSIKYMKNYVFDLNGAIHYRFLEHFRLTMRTKYLYDIEVNKRPKIINNFILGFYLNNTF